MCDFIKLKNYTSNFCIKFFILSTIINKLIKMSKKYL